MSEQAVFDALKYHIKVDSCGTRWYFNSAGQLHRDDGPAIESPDNSKYWYQNDQCHRTDGAAVEYANGYKRWFIHGVEMPAAEFNQVISQTKCLK